MVGVASDMVCSTGSLCFEGKHTLAVTQAESSEHGHETMSQDNVQETKPWTAGLRSKSCKMSNYAIKSFCCIFSDNPYLR